MAEFRRSPTGEHTKYFVNFISIDYAAIGFSGIVFDEKSAHMAMMLNTDESRSEEGEPTPGPDRPARNLFQQGVVAVIRSALAIIGVILIPLGVIIAFLTPILPVGLPIVILGVVLVARNADWGTRAFQSILNRYPALERFAPDWLLKLIFGDHR